MIEREKRREGEGRGISLDVSMASWEEEFRDFRGFKEWCLLFTLSCLGFFSVWAGVCICTYT